MSQSRRASLIEAAANVGGGFILSLALQLVLFPAYGMHPSMGQNLQITLAFTALTLTRSYAIRRFFNWIGP